MLYNTFKHRRNSIVKHRVMCMVSGQTFYVECYARNRQEAINVALSQYPNARVMSSTIVY